MGDLKALRLDCAKGDIYGVYSAFSAQAYCIHQNIYLSQVSKTFDQTQFDQSIFSKMPIIWTLNRF